MSTANKILMGASGAGGPVGPSDDEFNRVSFLSHFEGANNGVNNQFTDGSASNHTITANGNVTQGSFGPFARPDGEWGVSFDGDSDYLQVAESSDFDFGTGDFTVEFFFFARDSGSYEYLVTFGNNSGATTSLGIYIAGGTAINLWNNGAITSSTSYNLNQFYHLAVARASGTVKVYLDGSEINSASNSSDISSPGGMNVGRWGLAGDGQYFNGVISNLRVVKGTAVYTGNFTAPTSKLTAITNTKLLTCQSNRFLDNSATGHTVTPYATSAVTAFGPFLTSAVYNAAVNGASVNFNGVSDYITVADSSDFTLGNTFTLEAWIYPTASNNYNSVQNQNGSLGYYWAHVSGEKMQFYRGVTSAIQHDSAASSMVNQWTHVAYVCDAGTAYHYINGVRSGSSVSMSVADISAVITIGAQGSNFPFPGFISDYRMVVGTAVYSGSTYTLPTAPLTAITNTKLLLNMADGQAIDSTAQRNLSLENGTNISTAQAKFGNSSLYFDGTTDTATVIGSENVNFGAANFTVEGWIRPASFSGYKPNIISKWTDGSRGWAVRLVASGSGFVMRFTFSTDGNIDSSLDATTVLAFDTWHNFAFVQNSNTVTCYSNGAANGTISCSTIFASTNPIILGDWDSNQADYNGYIDDIRVTTGVARYTSNFTVPSEPFADKGQ